MQRTAGIEDILERLLAQCIEHGVCIAGEDARGFLEYCDYNDTCWQFYLVTLPETSDTYQ